MIDNTPEEFYRGLSSSDMVTEQGYPTEAAFKFDSYDKTGRDDGFCELSVNWNDGKGALKALLEQRKPHKDIPQFKVGY